MKLRSVCAITLAGLAIAAAPTAAAADPYHVVYSGTITDGSDKDGLFGTIGQDLTGINISADITYLTSVPGTRITSAVDDEVAGGFRFGTDPVITSALFTVGATSFTITPTFYDDVYASATFLDAYGYDLLGNSFETYIQPTGGTGPRNLQTFFSGPGTSDTGGGATQYSYVAFGNDQIDFSPTSVLMSAVPEPAAWGTMILGFGAVGGALRRRGKRTAAFG